MSDYLSVFRSPYGQEQVFSAYDEIMALWPVEYEDLYITTSLGSTHVIACGSEDAPPLILIHAFYASAASWYKNVEDLSKMFRVYCVDIVGDPNKSRPVKYMRQLTDFVDWLNELLDGLSIQEAYFVGNSVGAFHVANFALNVPQRVKRMILIGPAATFSQMMPFYINTFPGGMTGWPFLVNHAVHWTENGVRFDPAWRKLFYLLLRYGKSANQVFPQVYNDEQLPKINVPTLLLYGDKEVIYDIDSAAKRAKQFIPNIQVEIIEIANHITALSNPKPVNEAIIRFLK